MPPRLLPCLASLSCALSIAACAAPSRPATIANATPGATYLLQPLDLAGGEGRHSASHSSSEFRGRLELRNGAAELTLTVATSTSYVTCPGLPDGGVHGRQACAARTARPATTTVTHVLRGEARLDRGQWVTQLDGDHGEELALACDEAERGLHCAITRTTLFDPIGARPGHLTFVPPGTQRFSIDPVAVKDVGIVRGTIDVTTGDVEVRLALDGGVPVALPGQLRRTAHGVYVRAQTSPTRTFTATCQEASGGFVCDVTADRSVLGRPEHVYAQMILLTARG